MTTMTLETAVHEIRHMPSEQAIGWVANRFIQGRLLADQLEELSTLFDDKKRKQLYDPIERRRAEGPSSRPVRTGVEWSAKLKFAA
jgi:hypothetical protein